MEELKKYGSEIILMFALVIVYYMKRSYQNFSDTNFWMYIAAICGTYMYYKNKSGEHVNVFPFPSASSAPPAMTSGSSGEIPPFR